jgi:hypothetical protein
MRQQNKGFSESKLENKKFKINSTRINLKAKNNVKNNTIKTTKNTHYVAVECEGNVHAQCHFIEN